MSENNKIKILIAGSTATGKTGIGLVIKQALEEKGFCVELCDQEEIGLSYDLDRVMESIHGKTDISIDIKTLARSALRNASTDMEDQCKEFYNDIYGPFGPHGGK